MLLYVLGETEGVSPADGLGRPLAHSMGSAFSATAKTQSSITLTYTQTHTPTARKHIYHSIYNVNLWRHSPALKKNTFFVLL